MFPDEVVERPVAHTNSDASEEEEEELEQEYDDDDDDHDRAPAGAATDQDNLSTFLAAVHLEAFAKKFFSFGVEQVADLLELSDDDLRELGLKVLQIRRLHSALGTKKK